MFANSYTSTIAKILRLSYRYNFFFFNDTATTEIYTLSLHDALPISLHASCGSADSSPARIDSETWTPCAATFISMAARTKDRKSTRLNSSHLVISYAVFCLKKKKKVIV